MTLIIRLIELAGAVCIAALVVLALMGCVTLLTLILVAGRVRDVALSANRYLPEGAP